MIQPFISSKYHNLAPTSSPNKFDLPVDYPSPSLAQHLYRRTTMRAINLPDTPPESEPTPLQRYPRQFISRRLACPFVPSSSSGAEFVDQPLYHPFTPSPCRSSPL
ncbi:unnamed protein product [Tuber aestivum]|uniref:Uncharacterized protein n=1 Tax=Tuber aestivum TaxID=59557 RepID=A0A292PZX4_9PEZI|nr:unnamed protein product [Tuber aestivum]